MLKSMVYLSISLCVCACVCICTYVIKYAESKSEHGQMLHLEGPWEPGRRLKRDFQELSASVDVLCISCNVIKVRKGQRNFKEKC